MRPRKAAVSWRWAASASGLLVTMRYGQMAVRADECEDFQAVVTTCFYGVVYTTRAGYQ